ncbi:WXG100 family type VII secretion target [uncultured Parolsenella sp.]|uniref:WXG100 family type VII secretion target n=1 Tax=uncultured Parolsenella sp. TaxID=2083008 RepID=UPI0027D96192|nr:WXG100 family type VII secretion target [uncultured Parolsenella sp.]
MARIRITPQTMRRRAKEYRDERDRVNGVIKNMDSLLDTLQVEWEGEATTAYVRRFGEVRPSFVDAAKLIDEIATALDNTAKTLEQTDQAIAATFH